MGHMFGPATHPQILLAPPPAPAQTNKFRKLKNFLHYELQGTINNNKFKFKIKINNDLGNLILVLER